MSGLHALSQRRDASGSVKPSRENEIMRGPGRISLKGTEADQIPESQPAHENCVSSESANFESVSFRATNLILMPWLPNQHEESDRWCAALCSILSLG